MTNSRGDQAALEDLEDAAASACVVLQRVGGPEGSVVAQFAAGDWNGRLSADAATDLASLLRAMTEHVRFSREAVGEFTDDSAEVLDRPAVVTMFDSSLSLPLNRKERFYTGTVLPMLVASDGFMHLNRFVDLCGAPILAPDERFRDGMQRFEFFTEYSFVESVFTEANRARFGERPTDNDTPDLVFVGDDWLLAVEAKMYHNPSVLSLKRTAATATCDHCLRRGSSRHPGRESRSRVPAPGGLESHRLGGSRGRLGACPGRISRRRAPLLGRRARSSP
jgi:hypothetical protein